MKKLFFVVAVILLSASSSFAYRLGIEGITAYSETKGMTVNINSFCNYVEFDCVWYNSTNENRNGGAVAYTTSGSLIGEYSWSYPENQSYNRVVLGYNYWGTVQVYLSAYYCGGEATIEWGN